MGAAGVLKTWQGNAAIGSNTNWNNGLNWNTGIPAPQDSALIPLVSNVPTLGAAVILSTLTINSGSTVTLAGFGVSLSSFTNAGILALSGTENVTTAPNNLIGSTVTYIATSGSSVVNSSWTYSNLIINGTGGTFSNPATGSLGINQKLLVQAGAFNQNTLPIDGEYLYPDRWHLYGRNGRDDRDHQFQSVRNRRFQRADVEQ